VTYFCSSEVNIRSDDEEDEDAEVNKISGEELVGSVKKSYPNFDMRLVL
jgi:hypothetical protein